MARKRLFVVFGKGEILRHEFSGSNASVSAFVMDFLTIDFIVVSSAQEAIDKVFSAKKARMDDYCRKVEKFKQEGRLTEKMRVPLGELELFSPPSKPIGKEKWRAEEVKVSGYKIVLKPM